MTKSWLFKYLTCKIAENIAIAEEFWVTKHSAIAELYCTIYCNKWKLRVCHIFFSLFFFMICEKKTVFFARGKRSISTSWSTCFLLFQDKRIRFWDVRAGTEPLHELEFGGKVTSVDLSRNGQYLLACARDDTLRLVDSRSCQLVRTFATQGFSVPCDWSRACFTPDSDHVSVGSANGNIYIWRTDDASRPHTVLSEHSAPVISLAWQPAGNSLTSCDKQKNVVVWASIWVNCQQYDSSFHHLQVQPFALSLSFSYWRILFQICHNS